MSRKMTGIVKTFDRKSGKGFIIPSDGRKEVQVHISRIHSPRRRSAYTRITRGILPREWPAWTNSGKCLFVLMESARWYARFIHDLRETGQPTHALRISLFTSCQGQVHLSGRRI